MTTIIHLPQEIYKGYKIVNYSPQCFIVCKGTEDKQAVWEDHSFELCRKWIDRKEKSK